MPDTLPHTLAERFRVAPGKPVEPGPKRDPGGCLRLSGPGRGRGAEEGRRQGHQRAAGQALRRRQAGAAGGPAGHRHVGQGRHHPRRVQRDRAAWRHGARLPPAERRGAGARLPVARPPRPAPGRDRHLQPLALRGRAGGQGRGDSRRPSEIARTLRPDQRVRDACSTENGTVILKFMLHISKEEQGERLQERLDDPTSTGSSIRATSRTASCGTSTRPPTRSCSTAARRHGRRGT